MARTLVLSQCPAIHPGIGEVFGYDSFRGPQESIVRHVIDGGSALVLMPTGGGNRSVIRSQPSAGQAWPWWCPP